LGLFDRCKGQPLDVRRRRAHQADGGVQRPTAAFFYLHVPAAIWAEMAMILVACRAFLPVHEGPAARSFRPASSAEVGTIFCAIVLTTGPVWGKPIWGTWWTWDARLTFTLFLFLLYVVTYCCAVPSPIRDARTVRRRPRICGMCEVPFIHLSVYMFPTLHPMPIVLQPGRPSCRATC